MKKPYYHILFMTLLICSPLFLHVRAVRAEGKIIKKIYIKAPDEVDVSELRREINPLYGKPYNDKKINELIRALYLTDRFHNISVYTKKISPETLSVTFVVELVKRIAKISFSGNDQLSDIILLRSIFSHEDSIFEEARLLDDKETIEGLYKELGYYRASVNLRFFSPESSHLMNVVFEVEENEPTRIRSFTLDSDGRPKANALKPFFKMEEGDILKKDLLEQSILKLKQYLLEERYLEARYLPEKISFSKDLSTVDVYLKTIPGPKFLFEIKGAFELTEYELLSPLREYEETAPEISINDIIRHMLSSYRKEGFFHAEIFYRTYLNRKQNEKLVSIEIKERSRVLIKDWHIIGNLHFDQSYYEKVIKEHAAPLISSQVYSPDDLKKVPSIIVNNLKTNGFLFANAELGALHWDAKRTSISPEIKIEEGVQTVLDKINVSGNHNLTNEQILTALDLPIGGPIILLELERHIKKVTDLYKKNGFLKAIALHLQTEKLISYSKDYRSATLNLSVKEGPQMTIGQIIIRGTVRTRNRVIERELSLIEGVPWNPVNIRRTENRLLRLGLFSHVNISPLSGKFVPGKNDLLIEVSERLPGLSEAGGGFASDDGVRGFMGVAYRNIGGWHRIASARATINRPITGYRFIERKLELGFSEPYLGGIPFIARFNASHYKEASLPFDERSWQAKFSLDKWLFDFLFFDFNYTFEFRHIFRALDENDIQKNVAASLGPSFTFDFRDNVFNPTRGSLHSISTSFYLPAMGSSAKVDLVRSMLSTNWFFSPFSRLTIGLLGRAGYARSFSDTHPVPVDQRFFLGGRSTVRGFKEDIIGSDTKNNKVLENSFINYRAEAKVNLFSEFGVAAFYDGGNVFFTDINEPATLVNEFRHSVGAGLRYNTPIGPLSMDYGFILDRDKGQHENIGRFHIAIGQF